MYVNVQTSYALVWLFTLTDVIASYSPMIPEPMMELMKLNEAMGRVLLSFCAPSCGVVSWCRSLFDDSGLSGSCFCQ